MAIIQDIEKKGYAKKLGIRKGDELLGINGYPFTDILDYLYYDAESAFTLSIRTKKGKTRTIDVKKPQERSLGLVFGEEGEIKPIRCRNKCVFCFVDQLPAGMRETLYVKDDDYRLSFISGNYITLTNVSDAEIERIIRLKLSPLYLSVHCLEPETQKTMLANPACASLHARMQLLAGNGITMHAQIVLCKGLNDGEKLIQTLTALAGLYPQVASVAVVPVGLTKHREGLYPLERFDASAAKKVVQAVEKFNESFREKGGFCWCSDEFYLQAGLDLPAYESYGTFPQIENGVGLVETFKESFFARLEESAGSTAAFSVGFVTGTSFAPILKECILRAAEKFPNAKLQVYTVINTFFGESITVAGLLTGGDVLKQVQDAPAQIVIPSTMLREFTDTFLDGMTVPQLAEALHTQVLVSKDGSDIVSILENASENNQDGEKS